MRLIDTVMPSASLLDEVKFRKATEVGAELDSRINVSKEHLNNCYEVCKAFPQVEKQGKPEIRKSEIKPKKLYNDNRMSMRESILGNDNKRFSMSVKSSHGSVSPMRSGSFSGSFTSHGSMFNGLSNP